MNSIGIEEITSGSYSKTVFTFYDQGGNRIDAAPFRLNPANELYPYPHHIDKKNFDEWVKRTNNQTYPYDSRSGKLNEWGEKMKETFFRLVREGFFDTDSVKFAVFQRIY